MSFIHKLALEQITSVVYRGSGNRTVQNLLRKQILKRTRGISLIRNVSSASAAYDPYEVLGLERGVLADEVKQAYVKLSKQYHPDFNPGCEKSQEKFMKVNNAYRKIMERLDTSEDSEDSKNEQTKKYDFTISPLGIETEPLVERNPRRTLRNVAFCISLYLVVQTAYQWYLPDVVHRVKETVSPPKTAEQIKEMIRLDIIKRHKEEKDIEDHWRSLSK